MSEKPQNNSSVQVEDQDQIFYSSWGYDQTNVDFYLVKKPVLGKFSQVFQIGNKVTYQDSVGDCSVVPDLENVSQQIYKKAKVSKGYRGEFRIKINSFQDAYSWDGKAKHMTGPYNGR